MSDAPEAVSEPHINAEQVAAALRVTGPLKIEFIRAVLDAEFARGKEAGVRQAHDTIEGMRTAP